MPIDDILMEQGEMAAAANGQQSGPSPSTESGSQQQRAPTPKTVRIAHEDVRLIIDALELVVLVLILLRL